MLHSFSELVDMSLKLKDVIPLHHRFNEPGNRTTCIEVFRPDTYLQYNRGFGCANGVVAFIWENTMCVLPATANVMNILVKEAFVNDTRIAVPFAHGEIPFYNKDRKHWSKLNAEAILGNL